MKEHHLVLGGARSGKTAFALRSAEATGPTRIYVATGQALDAGMAARIAQHKAERGEGWKTIEEPLDLAEAVRRLPKADVVLIDCLTLWLSNLMHHERDAEMETAALLNALDGLDRPALIVSNEVGLSIVPENALARRFRDAQGLLNQRVAAEVARVSFIAAGLPMVLKAPG